MQRKTLMLRAVGYTVIEKWGCEYKEDKKTNAELKAFLNNHEAIPPLQPRDGFFGGRTGATTLYAKAEPDKEILYQDFKYPAGFPEAHLNASNQDIHSYFGVVLIDVLAPERLFHPVLPVREGGKLTFPLCSGCVKEEQQKLWLERSNVWSQRPRKSSLWYMVYA